MKRHRLSIVVCSYQQAAFLGQALVSGPRYLSYKSALDSIWPAESRLQAGVPAPQLRPIYVANHRYRAQRVLEGVSGEEAVRSQRLAA